MLGTTRAGARSAFLHSKAVPNGRLKVFGLERTNYSILSAPITKPKIWKTPFVCYTARNFYVSALRHTDSSRNPLNEATETDRIAILENTANAPWLNTLSPNLEDRLRVAYILNLQIALYLERPTGSDDGTQFLTAFGMAPVSAESDIGRARRAIIKITRAVVRHISSVPVSSPLRQNHRDVFDVFGALQALHDVYLVDGDSDPDFRQWSEFWTRFLPILIELSDKLDQKGFGLTKEDMNGLFMEEKQATKSNE